MLYNSAQLSGPFTSESRKEVAAGEFTLMEHDCFQIEADHDSRPTIALVLLKLNLRLQLQTQGCVDVIAITGGLHTYEYMSAATS